MADKGTMVKINATDGFDTDAYYLAAEEGAAGIICIMEAFGLNDPIKKVAEGYAEQGYAVIAPALYDRIERGATFDYDTELRDAVDIMLKNGFENPMHDVAGCIEFLKEQGVKRIGIVGFCYGGAVSWMAASRFSDIDAASCYYGTAILSFEDEDPKAPTIAHWGKRDVSTPAEGIQAVAKAHPQVTMYWYDAGHGFNSVERNDYDEASAKLASQRTLDFFDEKLRD